MKAIYNCTGELVEVEITPSEEEMEEKFPYRIISWGNAPVYCSADSITILNDEEEEEEEEYKRKLMNKRDDKIEFETPINWEQRRYDIAKSVFMMFVDKTTELDRVTDINTKEKFGMIFRDESPERVADYAFEYADAFIEKLRRNEQGRKVVQEMRVHEAVNVEIDSTIQINGVDYVCLNAENEDCCACDFLINGDCASPGWLICDPQSRKDGKNVKFIKKETSSYGQENT